MKLNFSNINILVAGDVILDEYIIGDVTRISPEAPVPVLKHTENKSTLGGAANVANNLISLGCNVTIVGTVGKDLNGKNIKQLLTNKGIKAKLIKLDNHPTTTKTRVLSHGHQICRIDIEKVNNDNSEILKRLLIFNIDFQEFDALIISDYSKGFIDQEVSQYLINQFREINKPIIVDPKKLDWKVYEAANIITPNFKEFSKTANISTNDIESIVKAGKEIIETYNLDNILVTRSEKGMLWIDRNHYINIDAKAKEVFDVSGAGDTVIATLAACISNGYTINKALNYANKAASIVVGKIGTIPITIGEIKRMMNMEYRSFTDLDDILKEINIGKNNVILSKFEDANFLSINNLKTYKRQKEDLLFIAILSDEYYLLKFGEKPTFLAQEKLTLFSHLDFIDGVTRIDNLEQEKLIVNKLIKK